ncbi:RNA polymerase sigma factor RpoE [Neisseria sp. Dent CA1/247]|uniref:RNA polymerase sigma factor n=1 Tax=Neisseria zoodegmatis TaxID=326523 RepID=A0A1X3CLU7_9NEIS|nr:MULTISPECIES: RNA polymerase sigma factor RpoE [Neisseria]MDO5070199.1 RNA polymerase sigma factor RpoE [Neisseria zoodegmatis]OSI08508.1 RNA polymerase sigma factor RpoE [Neisseria zoodegmatis]UOO76240.1 RNA polymerase sigma factor RpoE [Neisseria sp. Dent CA1/247]SNU80375.1 RNA polymerase sigma factor [Neisseria zoodegmatis]SUA44642.1 RNA polymerase sigma factor [Neisseria zoodegmatis]
MNDRKIDQALVERAQKGEHRAFELLVSKYQRRLTRLLSRFIKDEHEVNDVAQEALIKAYRALPNFRGESAFYTWLYRIGINTAKNFLATSGKRPFVSTDVANDEGDVLDLANQLADDHTPEAEMMNREILETVEAAITKLPDDLRKAISLREMDGLSYEEIAQIMDCPIGTVRSRIFRAREVIAKDLRPLLDTSEDQRW